METLTEEKQIILDRALANPTDENSIKIIQKAQARGWLAKPQETKPEPTTAQKAAGFGLGVAEAYNPLSIPRSVEVIGRALMEPNKFTGEYSKGIAPVPETQSFGENLALAESKAVTPDLSVKGLLSKIPGTKTFLEGVPQSYETAGGLAALGYGGVKGLRGMIKGSPVKQATKATEGVVQDVKFLMNEPEGPIMDAILQRPEKVAELYKQQKFGVDDLSQVIVSALEKKGNELRKTVTGFRDLAIADDTKSIPTKPLIDILDKAENRWKLSSGKTTLSKKDLAKFKEMRSYLEADKVSPRDALTITDWIDNNTNYESVANGNISKAAANAVKEFRQALKGQVRSSSGKMEQWAKADDQMSSFIELADDLPDKFSGDGRVNSINSLLNPSKDPLKQRVANALNIGSEAGPIKSEADDFFNLLAERRAAQGMKNLDVSKVDPIRDQTNRMYQKWIKRVENLGQSAGTVTATGLGMNAMGPAGAAMGIAGFAPGGLLAKVAGGEKFARYMASPERLLKKAQEAKTLSQDAKELAKDLSFLQKNFGVEGANLLINSLKGSIPAVNELARYVEAQ